MIKQIFWRGLVFLRLTLPLVTDQLVCRVTKGHLRVTIGHLRVTIDHLRGTIGCFFL